MPLNYAGAKNVATSTESENDFDPRKMIVLNATYRLSKSLESFEDGKEEAFLNVALSKLTMHELGKFRLPAPVDPQNPTPAEDPQTKFDEERGRRGKKQQAPQDQNDEADPVPDEERLLQLRRGLVSAQDAEKMQVDGDRRA